MKRAVMKTENFPSGFAVIVTEQEDHYDNECESKFISIDTHLAIINKMQKDIGKLQIEIERNKETLRQRDRDIKLKDELIEMLMAQSNTLESNALFAMTKRENADDLLNVETIEPLTETLSATSDMDDATRATNLSMSSEESYVSSSSIFFFFQYL